MTANDERSIALAAIRSHEGPEIAHILALVDMHAAPALVADAVDAAFTSQADYANGGADQYVWNTGVDEVRRVGRVWCEVGALENGELLLQLADTLEGLQGDPTAEDGVTGFLAFRKQIGGPYFSVPSVMEELSTALVEWAVEHPDAFG